MIKLEELSNQELACIEARSKDRLRDIEDEAVDIKNTLLKIVMIRHERNEDK